MLIFMVSLPFEAFPAAVGGKTLGLWPPAQREMCSTIKRRPRAPSLAKKSLGSAVATERGAELRSRVIDACLHRFRRDAQNLGDVVLRAFFDRK